MDETMTTPEGKVKAKLKAALDKAFPGHYRFCPVQTGYGAKTLDFLLCVGGKFVSVETKAPGKPLTPLQESTVSAIEKAGGLVCVVSDEESLALCLTKISLTSAPTAPNTGTKTTPM